MKPTFAFLILFLGLEAHSQVKIEVAGAMSNIMRKGDMSAHADLDTMKKKNLYALGPMEGLKGEMMVLDGEVFITSKSGDSLGNKDDISKAAMLVYSYVSEWKKIEIRSKITGIAELEMFIEKIAKENKMDLRQPFVFRIEAKTKSLDYHVIDWKEGETHTTDNHKQFAYTINEAGQNAILLGFYSDKHHSIFTHHSTNIHVHVLNEKTKTVGHLDNLDIDGNLTIYFSQK